MSFINLDSPDTYGDGTIQSITKILYERGEWICHHNSPEWIVDIGDLKGSCEYVASFKYLDQTQLLTFYCFVTHTRIVYKLPATNGCVIHLSIVVCDKDNPHISWIRGGKSVPTPSMKPGIYLMNLAHRLLSFLGYTSAELDDDSYIDFGNDVMALLWLYLLLTRGTGWYYKFGYHPVHTEEEIQPYKEIVQNIDLDVCRLIMGEKYNKPPPDTVSGKLGDCLKTHGLGLLALLFQPIYRNEEWYQHYLSLSDIYESQRTDTLHFIKLNSIS